MPVAGASSSSSSAMWTRAHLPPVCSCLAVAWPRDLHVTACCAAAGHPRQQRRALLPGRLPVRGGQVPGRSGHRQQPRSYRAATGVCRGSRCVQVCAGVCRCVLPSSLACPPTVPRPPHQPPGAQALVLSHSCGAQSQLWCSVTAVVLSHSCGAQPQLWCSATAVVLRHSCGAQPQLWCSVTAVVLSHSCGAQSLVLSHSCGAQSLVLSHSCGAQSQLWCSVTGAQSQLWLSVTGSQSQLQPPPPAECQRR
jgi:hypothetical protein